MLIADLSHIAYRSWYVLNGKGAPSPSTVWGVFQSLQKWQKTDRKIVFALDSGVAYRREVLPSYKERLLTPLKRALLCQRSICEHVLAGLGFKCYYSPGWEADDVIATMVRMYLDRTKETIVIATSDHDLFTLLSDRVSILWTDRLFTYQDFIEKYQLEPAQWPDVKALMGDKGDNVPGIPQVGEKRARNLVREFGDLSAILNSDKDFPYAAKVREYRKQVEEAHFLVSLHTVPLQLLESKLSWRPEWLGGI